MCGDTHANTSHQQSDTVDTQLISSGLRRVIHAGIVNQNDRSLELSSVKRGQNDRSIELSSVKRFQSNISSNHSSLPKLHDLNRYHEIDTDKSNFENL